MTHYLTLLVKYETCRHSDHTKKYEQKQVAHPQQGTITAQYSKERESRYGGGKQTKKAQATQCTQNTSESTFTNQNEQQWVLSHNNIFQTQSRSHLTNHILPNWHPATGIPYNRSNHPQLSQIDDLTILTIKETCKLPLTHTILRSYHQKSITWSTENLHNLISYNSEINDDTILIYLELLSRTENIAYLYTDFYPRLKTNSKIIRD
jgi:hypothetical protein